MTSVLLLMASAFAFADSPVSFQVKPPVKELSAMVWDSARNVYWSLSDGGNPPELARTDGATLKTQLRKIAGAKNVDWEALVLDRTVDRKGRLWIVDAGDNESERGAIKLYEYDPERGQVLRTFKVHYQGGARDVEAAVLDTTAGYPRMMLIEKSYVGKSTVAAVDLRSSAPYEQTISDLGRFTLPDAITDASVSPSGVIYFLGYGGVYRCDECFNSKRQLVRMVRQGFLGQTEALVALSDDRFLVGNENGYVMEWPKSRISNPREIPRVSKKERRKHE